MREKNLKRLTIWTIAASSLVFFCGWFSDLPDAGASRLATTTLNLLQNRQYLGEWGRYQDQPVLLLWISAASMITLGIHEVGFRLPGFLITLFTLYATYRLARVTGNRSVGLLSVLITVTLQSTFLLNQNVSEETYSSAFYTFMIWQLVAYFRRKSVQHFALSLLGLLLMLLSRRAAGAAETSFNPIFPILTVLWAFAPWTLLLVMSVLERLRKLSAQFTDRLTFFAFVIPLALMCLNPFQTTYDVFVILPVAAVVTAGYLSRLLENQRSPYFKKLYSMQLIVSYVILGLLFALVWFPFAANNYYGLLHFLGLLSFLTWLVFFSRIKNKLLVSCIVLAIGSNLVLNTYFFPNMMAYQAGSRLGKMAKENGVSEHKLFCYQTDEPYSLHFYSGVDPETKVDFNALIKTKNCLVYTDRKFLDQFRKLRPDLKIIGQSENFPVSKPAWKFLDPQTRESASTRKVLIGL